MPEALRPHVTSMRVRRFLHLLLKLHILFNNETILNYETNVSVLQIVELQNVNSLKYLFMNNGNTADFLKRLSRPFWLRWS